MLSILTGLAAGSLHVVTGPDHLAALAPLALRDRRRATWTGATWGAGHGLGVVAVGLIAMLARSLIDAELISVWSEFLVGFLLLGVGGWALWAARKITIHKHGHHHGEHDHDHMHVHVAEVSHDSAAHRGHLHAALGVGMLHGAAGTGHLLGVLPTLALDNVSATFYLISYLIGAIASMALFGSVLGLVAHRGGPGLVRGLMVASGAVAILVGGFWLAGGPPSIW